MAESSCDQGFFVDLVSLQLKYYQVCKLVVMNFCNESTKGQWKRISARPKDATPPTKATPTKIPWGYRMLFSKRSWHPPITLVLASTTVITHAVRICISSSWRLWMSSHCGLLLLYYTHEPISKCKQYYTKDKFYLQCIFYGMLLHVTSWLREMEKLKDLPFINWQVVCIMDTNDVKVKRYPGGMRMGRASPWANQAGP